LEQRALEQQAAPQTVKPGHHRQDKPKKSTPPELRQFNIWPVEKIERTIEETEREIQEIHASFNDEKVYKDYKMLAKVQSELNEKQQYLDLLYRAYELKTSKN
jgi:hypothetical protein